MIVDTTRLRFNRYNKIVPYLPGMSPGFSIHFRVILYSPDCDHFHKHHHIPSPIPCMILYLSFHYLRYCTPFYSNVTLHRTNAPKNQIRSYFRTNFSSLPDFMELFRSEESLITDYYNRIKRNAA